MTQTEPAGWEVALWDELNSLPETERLIQLSFLIHYLGRNLLTKLADARRFLILDMLEDSEIDATTIGEMIGSRRVTIQRLADEGRRRRRDQG